MAQFAPELQRVALGLYTSACTQARLWELILAVVALSLEEGVDSVALLAGFALFTGKVAVLDDLAHALVPVFGGKLALVRVKTVVLISLSVLLGAFSVGILLEHRRAFCRSSSSCILSVTLPAMFHLGPICVSYRRNRLYCLLCRHCGVWPSVELRIALEAVVWLVCGEHGVAVDADLLLRDDVLFFFVQALAREKCVLVDMVSDLLKDCLCEALNQCHPVLR